MREIEMMRKTDASQPRLLLFPFTPESLSDQRVGSGGSNDSVGANRGGAKSSNGEESGPAHEMGWDAEVSDNHQEEEGEMRRERARDGVLPSPRAVADGWEPCVRRSSPLAGAH